MRVKQALQRAGELLLEVFEEAGERELRLEGVAA
jgi:hypothetical protein